MIDLQKVSGLPIALTDDFHLRFGEPLKQTEPGVRVFADMVPVLMNQGAKPNPARTEMYYMYRDVHLPEHEAVIRANHLRYDLTVIPPAMLGEEFNKTVGHYHPPVPGKDLAYPELYEVLEGSALFLIQKVDATGKEIHDIQAIKAKVGDKVIYPPGYGHIIVNIGSGPLVTANWESADFESLYQPIKDMAGIGYYVVSDGIGGFKFAQNTKYGYMPAIKSSGTADSGWGLNKEEPMYLMGVGNVANLKFLNNPEILTLG